MDDTENATGKNRLRMCLNIYFGLIRHGFSTRRSGTHAKMEKLSTVNANR